MKRAAPLVSLALLFLPACTEKPKGPPLPPPSRFTEVTHLDAAVTEVKGYALVDGIAFATKSGEGKDEKVAVMVDGVAVRTNLPEFPEAVTGKRGAVYVIGNHQTRLSPPGFVWEPLNGVGEIAKDHWIGFEQRERRGDEDKVAVSLRGKGPAPQPPDNHRALDVALNGDGQMCAVVRKYVDGNASSWSAWSVAKDGKEQVIELAGTYDEPPRATRAANANAECVIVSTDAAEGQRHIVIRRFTDQGLVRLHDLPIPERYPHALSKDGHLWYLGTVPGSPETPELHHVALDLKSATPVDDASPLPPTIPGCPNPHPRSIFPSAGEDVWLELECDSPKHRALLHAPTRR